MTNISQINHGVLIEPLNTDQFLKVAETLTRCGVRSSREEKPTLWQSCHVLFKRGEYYIMHFKELFLLDGKLSSTKIDQGDYDRRNLIAINLQTWGLIKIRSDISYPEFNINLTIIPFSDKHNWNIRSKYSIGKNYRGTNYE